MKQLFLVALLVVLPMWFVSNGAAAGETNVHMWKDAQGNVHFGDQASAPTYADEMVVRTTDPAAASAVQQAAGKEQQAESKENSQACKDARKRLADYERAPFLTEVDADGKKHILPESERQELLVSVKELVKEACE